MRSTGEAVDHIGAGLAALRVDLGLPGPFSAEVVAAANSAAARTHEHLADRRDIELATLDPQGSTDLDQAFAVGMVGTDVELIYAIADVASFVTEGDVIDVEAWRRGETFYAPDGRIPQYPEVLCEDAASLLPEADRPAVVLTVRVDPDGIARLEHAERALVRSRSQLAYESTPTDALPEALQELHRRISAAEHARGAERIEFPEQELLNDPSAPGGVRLEVRIRRDSEDVNASMSLAANLAIGAYFLDAGVGLFRVMPEPGEAAVNALRREAECLGITWGADEGLKSVSARLDANDPRHVAFLLAARRAGGGAGYRMWRRGDPTPLHAAIAAPYVHATAPLRRLADRSVLDLVLRLQASQSLDDRFLDRLSRLPAVMARADSLSSRLDRTAIDYIESVMLAGRVGERFAATVIDADADHAHIALDALPVRAMATLRAATPGQHVQVTLTAADPARRHIAFAPA